MDDPSEHLSNHLSLNASQLTHLTGRDIEGVIKKLTTGTPQVQQDTLRKHFVADAAFIHPFCYVPRFTKAPVLGFSSLWVLLCIYRWYRILSPKIDISIDSVAFDEKQGLLYVSIRQVFSIWFVPFYSAPVKLVTVLKVESRAADSSGRIAARASDVVDSKWFITSQEDLYQMNDCIQFGLPRVGNAIWTIWQLCSTVICVIMSLLFLPLYFLFNKPKKE